MNLMPQAHAVIMCDTKPLPVSYNWCFMTYNTFCDPLIFVLVTEKKPMHPKFDLNSVQTHELWMMHGTFHASWNLVFHTEPQRPL